MMSFGRRRSEERRVGKECRSRGKTDEERKILLQVRQINDGRREKFRVLEFLQALGFFFSSRRRHTRSLRDWSSDVCSSDLTFIITRSEPLMMKVPSSVSRGRSPR